MELDRVDICHEEITNECDEYLVLSVQEKEGEEHYRINVQANPEGILSQFILDDMVDNKEFANFIISLADKYKQLN